MNEMAEFMSDTPQCVAEECVSVLVEFFSAMHRWEFEGVRQIRKSKHEFSPGIDGQYRELRSIFQRYCMNPEPARNSVPKAP